MNRRRFLTLTATLPLGVAAAAQALLAGCRKERLKCDDVSGLTEAEKTARNAANYQERSPRAGQTCANCAQYQPAAAEGQCGGCKVLAGPVNPAGWCNLWVKKPS